MKIGELAELTACEVETVRYYEREGLLPPPPRSEGNYRNYGLQYVELLSFIRHCRSLGMSLDDVRTLQSFQARPESACGEVDALLDRKLDETQERIASLQRLQKQLLALRKTCRSQLTARQCGILRNLRADAGSSNCVCHAGEAPAE